MRIAVDAMGGDNAPQPIVAGAVESLALLGSNDQLILVGAKDVIQSHLGPHPDPRIEIVDASQVIGMNDSPVEAVRQKRDSSIVKMVRLAADGKVDAVISAGNTGALTAAGVLFIKPLPGVERPGIAVTLPTSTGYCLLCDAGSNVQAKPVHLHQYAHLAAIYSEVLFAKTKPRVGLLNIGTEDEKGTPLVKETKALLVADKTLNFVGYVEGRDIFSDCCDVVITDGFTGNMVLKVVEGLSMSLLGQFKSAAKAHSPEALSALGPVLKSVMARFDHEEYGGALLLGLSRVFLKVHGSGGARAIRNAVKTAKQAVDLDVNRRIVERLAANNVQ